MSRKTTEESLERLQSGNINKSIDKIARMLLLKLSTGECIVTLQDSFEDEEYIYTDYYGEYKGIGVTCRNIKKIRGINPRFVMIIETDDEEIKLPGPIGAKAWSLAKIQQKNTTIKSISKKTMLNVMKTLNIGEDDEDDEE